MNDRLHRRASAFGFTLIEILVAMSIIAISLTAVYRMHSQTLAMAYTTNFYVTAPLLAQKKMVELQLKPADELVDESGDFGEDFPSFSWKATVNGVESELLAQTREDLKRIDVTVVYSAGRLEFSLRRYLLIRE